MKSIFSLQGNVDGRWSHDLYQGGVGRVQPLSGPAKLLISNLDFGVSDSDIHVSTYSLVTLQFRVVVN